MSICGIDCYKKDGVAYLRLETAARELGFTTVATSGNEVVRWNRVRRHLTELGVPTGGGEDEELTGKEGLPEFIPENIFYRLAMKARNETAENFQALIADKVIPSIRRTGTYRMIAAPLPPESADGVARLITALRSTMKDNGQPPESISRMVKGLCDQLGIVLPVDFVKANPFEQLSIPMNETAAPIKNF